MTGAQAPIDSPCGRTLDLSHRSNTINVEVHHGAPKAGYFLASIWTAGKVCSCTHVPFIVRASISRVQNADNAWMIVKYQHIKPALDNISKPWQSGVCMDVAAARPARILQQLNGDMRVALNCRNFITSFLLHWFTITNSINNINKFFALRRPLPILG